jgi:hypothetical protein
MYVDDGRSNTASSRLSGCTVGSVMKVLHVITWYVMYASAVASKLGGGFYVDTYATSLYEALHSDEETETETETEMAPDFLMQYDMCVEERSSPPLAVVRPLDFMDTLMQNALHVLDNVRHDAWGHFAKEIGRIGENL